MMSLFETTIQNPFLPKLFTVLNDYLHHYSFIEILNTKNNKHKRFLNSE